ncbi:MAG: co-chaperone GroES [Dermatophilaceae bacterium]
MLADRVLVCVDAERGERKSGGGILIPATASVGKRLVWASVVATGHAVRHIEVDDRVLFDPEDRHEVELQSQEYILLREKDIHAVAASRVDDGQTGLYL